MFRISDSVRSTHGQDGAAVLDVQQGKIYSLNLVGSKIFELVKTGISETDVVDRISREFGVSRDVAQSDTRAFIQQLQSMELLE